METNIPMQTRYRYCMHCSDINALYNHLPFDVFGTLCLAFDYGMAKGYRAAKAEKVNSLMLTQKFRQSGYGLTEFCLEVKYGNF